MGRDALLDRRPVIGARASAGRAGFALEQVAIAIGVAAILLAAIAVSVPGRRDQALARQAVRDAQTIADAAVRYRWRTGRWPGNVADLTADELPANSATTNRFGFPYVVAAAGYQVVVSTSIPLPAIPTSAGTGLSTVSAGGQTVVTVTRTLTDDGVAQAVYSKRHLYRE
jgi:type II secretory pathway pseudopilin PulG